MRHRTENRVCRCREMTRKEKRLNRNTEKPDRVVEENAHKPVGGGGGGGGKSVTTAG